MAMSIMELKKATTSDFTDAVFPFILISEYGAITFPCHYEMSLNSLPCLHDFGLEENNCPTILTSFGRNAASRSIR